MSFIILSIDWAALNGRCDIIEILIEVGADANLKNEFDHVPLEEALQNGFTQAAEILAKFTKLSEDKLYTSIMEEPENEEEEKKGGEDEMFPDDEDDDKRSYQSEEAMKPEVPVRQPTTEELAKKDEAKMQQLSNEIKDRFGMQEFDIEIKKINDGQQNK